MKAQAELELIDEFEENSKWLEENREKLRKKYLDMFIAILDKKVIAAEKEFKAVLTQLKKQKKDPTTIIIEFVPKEKIELLL